MNRNRQVLCVSLLVAVSIAIAFPALAAAAAPTYAITAANVTMPRVGIGSLPYTVAGIPMTGILAITCQYSGPPTTAKIPLCFQAIAPAPVTAGQTVKGVVGLFPPNGPVPASLHGTNRAPWTGLALAGVLIVGVGLRRRARSWLVLTLFAGASLAGLAAISACGGSMNGMTPGTYQYTVTADNEANSMTPLGQGVSTTITVTVP
jgi:hypothetical protein